jgi:aminopeptidase N
MRWLIARFWIFLLCVPGWADTYVRQSGIDILQYDISLELTDTSDSISGTARIHARIKEKEACRMRLDFSGMQVDRLTVGGSPRNFVSSDGQLSFDFGRRFAREEIAVVEVRYHGKPERGLLIGSNRYGRRTFFAENWPDRAHYWFPCVDHPSDKAAARVTVTVPKRYEVVSIGSMVQAKALKGDRKQWQWVERRDIPTYSIVIGVAEFSVARPKAFKGTQLAWYAYPEDSGAAAEVFGKTASALGHFGALIGPYPYKKLSQVEANVNFQGMENASAIFYSESLFARGSNPSNTVIHEIAHQWFGDSVTPADWDHLWLSEGFATYMEALFRERTQGPGALKLAMDECARQLAESKDARSIPIVDPDRADVMKKLNVLNYQKGAWVLHMLRGVMGDARFFKGLRKFYSAYAGRNVTSEDFCRVMESAAGIRLDHFFHQWLYQPGWPEYTLSWQWDASSKEAEISIRQSAAPRLFDVSVDIAFEVEARRVVRRVRVFNAEHTFGIPLPSKPLSVQIDPDGWLLKSLQAATN